MITVDDDIFYPTFTIEELLKESLKYSFPVVVSRYFSAITQDNLGNCLPYIEWKQLTDKSRDKIFLVQVVELYSLRGYCIKMFVMLTFFKV